MPRRIRIATAAVLVCLGALVWWLVPSGRETPPPFPSARTVARWHADDPNAQNHRATALRQARVWTPANPRHADLARNPPDPSGSLSAPIVRCKYRPREAHGTTPKFDCILADGEVIKVKYGRTAEINAEVAASRLLTALGFGADHMYLIPHLRCYGCVRTPFYTVWAFDLFDARALIDRIAGGDRFTDFKSVAVERRFEGHEIATDDQEGWAWFELDEIDRARGANRAERDALRLAALLLAHWDNKMENQRLVCRSPQDEGDGPCPRPFAYMQDLGATLGPRKLDVENWRKAPIWADAASCRVSMRTMPYDGGTFRDAYISEAGRQLMARQLSALTESQITALFTAARVREFHRTGEGADAYSWAQAFFDRVRQIVDARCP